MNASSSTLYAVSRPRRRTFGFFDRASFLSRADLFASCDGPILMVVVELVKSGDGLRGADRDELMAELENDLAETAGTNGSCFRLRKNELCVLVPDVDVDTADPVLDEIAAAARATPALLAADVVIGEVVVPDEACDPRSALRVADERLRTQRRERGIEKKGLVIGHRDTSRTPKPTGLGSFFRESDDVTLVYEREPAIEPGDAANDLV